MLGYCKVIVSVLFMHLAVSPRRPGVQSGTGLCRDNSADRDDGWSSLRCNSPFRSPSERWSVVIHEHSPHHTVDALSRGSSALSICHFYETRCEIRAI